MDKLREELRNLGLERYEDALEQSGWDDCDLFRLLIICFCFQKQAFFRLPRETSTLNNYHSEDSRDSGSGKIEFSLKSTTFFTLVTPLEVE